MFTYTCKRPNIIQIALKGIPVEGIIEMPSLPILGSNIRGLPKTYSPQQIRLYYLDFVRSTARHAIHLQFDISAIVLEIRAAESSECTV
jgi:hypothetical protein